MVYSSSTAGDIDDRVRAIVSALGFRMILWSKSSEDASVKETPMNRDNTIRLIQSWFNAGPGFISLQHDFSEFTSEIAVSAMSSFSASTPMRPKPIGECIQDKWYKGDGVAVPATSTMLTPKATPSSATSNGTAFVAQAPSPIPENKSAAVKLLNDMALVWLLLMI